MTEKSTLLEEEQSFQTEDSEQPIPPADIVAYNELRSCADLFRLHSSGKLEIQPDFQREVVWKQDDQSRFIDSLVKQLPIPSMCFSLDYRTQKWKVIDGLQRMSSIIRFLSDKEEWKLSDLPDTHPLLRKTSNLTLRNGTEEQKRVFALVEDVSIPVTVIRCDYTQKNHMRYLFTIFHRLNSGGVRLTNQEIRNCIFTGAFNDLLKKFDRENSDWKAVKKRIWGKMDRYRSVEVLLRILAFGDQLAEYDGNLARFLSDYMQSKHALPGEEVAQFADRLAQVASRFRFALADETKRKLPLLLAEAVLVGLYVNRDLVATLGAPELKRRYTAMTKQPTFSDSARYAVSSVDNVKVRLGAAIAAFAPEK